VVGCGHRPKETPPMPKQPAIPGLRDAMKKKLEKRSFAACHFVAVGCWKCFEPLMSLFVKSVSACAEIVHFMGRKTVGNTSKFC
jgi:hypothetical protein